MPADASIYGLIKPAQQFNPLEQYAQVAQIKGMQNQSDLAQYTIGKAKREDDDNALLRAALAEPGADPYKALLGVGKVKEAGEYQKSQNDAAKAGAETKKIGLEAANLALTQHRAMLNTVNDPESAKQWLVAAYQNPDTKGIFERMGPLSEAIRRFDAGVTTPEQFATWKRGASLNADELIKYTTPDANTVANNATSTANNAATNATHVQTTGMTNTTSRANNRDTIAAENVRAGVVPGGGLDENTERTAQAIANGQLPAPTGMALLNPKNQRILGRVMEINPQYDSTTVDAKKKAARDFTSGTQGNAMRSFAVAGQHLDQLGTLVDALDNGNMQIVNRIGNAISQQTGSPAVTNFDAAKDVVSKEVIKAIVAGGGGVSEREELSKLMANAKSPAQLKGVIQQYRNLMGAQHDALLTQRRAAGLPDSTLPKYDDANGSPNAPEVPSDIAAILAKHGPRKGM